jgi:hypothetical protein
MRLLDSADCPQDLVEALAAAGREFPRPEDLAEMEARLSPLAARSPLSRPTSIRPVAAGAAIGFKLLLVAAVAGAALGGLRYARSWRTASLTPTTTAPSGIVAPSVTPRSNGPSPGATTDNVEERAIVDLPRIEDPRRDVEDPFPREPSRKPVERSPIAALPTAATPEPSSGAPNAGAFPNDTAADEVALVDRASRTLGSDANAALRLAEEHAQRFPNGALTQEREFVAIEALKLLGRTAEANDRIDRFRVRFPGSAHLRRLERWRAPEAP